MGGEEVWCLIQGKYRQYSIQVWEEGPNLQRACQSPSFPDSFGRKRLSQELHEFMRICMRRIGQISESLSEIECKRKEKKYGILNSCLESKW